MPSRAILNAASLLYGTISNSNRSERLLHDYHIASLRYQKQSSIRKVVCDKMESNRTHPTKNLLTFSISERMTLKKSVSASSSAPGRGTEYEEGSSS